MKPTMIAVAAASLLAAAGAPAALAQHAAPPTRVQYAQHDGRWDGNPRDDERQLNVDERQSRLQDRIQRGFDNGRLTREEARRMQRRLDETESKQRAYASDGRLTRREEASLQADLDDVANRLRNQMRDEDRRY